MKRLPFITSLLALALLSASIAYWALQLYKPPQRPIAAVPQGAAPEPPVEAAAALFGGAGVAAPSNFQLTGVIASGPASVAIIAAGGQPAKAVKIGREVAPGVTLQEVQPRYVVLSEGGVSKRVDLMADVKPALSMAAPSPGNAQQVQPLPQTPPAPPQVAPFAPANPMPQAGQGQPAQAAPAFTLPGTQGQPAAGVAQPPAQMPAPVHGGGIMGGEPQPPAR